MSEAPAVSRRGRRRGLHGTLTVTRRGLGIVDLGPREPRVFVDASDQGDAVHGDEVEIRIHPRRQQDRRQGRIVRVITRRERRLAGTVMQASGRHPGWLFSPVVTRYPRGLLDAGGRAAEIEAGQRVTVLLQGGGNPGPPRYKLADLLSDGVDARLDPIDIAHELGLRLSFPPPVTDLATRRAALPLGLEGDGPPRIDLRHLPCVTIDPTDAADFDDAVSWRVLPDGEQEVGIHIADVAYFVESGDAIDAEARERATSIYMPGLTLHMLPEPLSAGSASLRPETERAALSVLAVLDADCRVRTWRVERSLIRSRQRLTYADAAALLTDGRPDPVEAENGPRDLGDIVSRVLLGASRVAQTLRRRRLRRSGLYLELPEYQVQLDTDGQPTRVAQKRSGVAHQLVEEHMLLANELIGGWARTARLPILYRVHERPRWERLLELGLVLQEMGLDPGRRNLGDPRELERLIEEAATRGLGELASFHVLRALEKAHYAAEDCGHFGLGIEGYCHFTSPIRRYPDLHTHRVTLAAVTALGGGDETARNAADADGRLRGVRRTYVPGLEELAAFTSGRELDAQRAERQATRVKILRLLEPRLGAVVGGIISDVTGAGCEVLLDEYPTTGWVTLERLPRDRYRLGSRGKSLEGRRQGDVFAVGQRVQVQIVQISIAQRELELSVVDGATSADTT